MSSLTVMGQIITTDVTLYERDLLSTLRTAAISVTQAADLVNYDADHREEWESLVKAELDLLYTKEPQAYRRIAHFLAVPASEINGTSFRTCFYGQINDYDFERASQMAGYMRVQCKTRQLSSLCGGTPIEELVYWFYPHPRIAGPVQGVTRELFFGWIQEHFAQHPPVEQPSEEPPSKKAWQPWERMRRMYYRPPWERVLSGPDLRAEPERELCSV
jgi:hypothetical protein